MSRLDLSNGSAQTVSAASLTLTNAQILIAPSSSGYLTVVAAPASSKCHVFLGGFFQLNATGGAYTNVTSAADAGWAIVYGDKLWDASDYVKLSNTAYNITGMWAPMQRAASSSATTPGYPPTGVTVASSSGGIAGQALKLIAWNSTQGNFTGGNGSNSGMAYINYITVAMTS